MTSEPIVESSFSRLTDWVHWVRQDENPDPQNVTRANDIDKFIQVANAAHDVLSKVSKEARTEEEKELQLKIDLLWVP